MGCGEESPFFFVLVFGGVAYRPGDVGELSLSNFGKGGGVSGPGEVEHLACNGCESVYE